MRKLTQAVALAILLAGGAVSAPANAQGYASYNYPPPPPNPYAIPWVGPNTPWVYYNGDWFLNGTLYYYFGDAYGWAPYYAYSPTFILRPNNWYAPMWNVWYQGHPNYWHNFVRTYPYWREHRQGHHYDQKFYERHHHGQGGGWQRGVHGEGRHEERHHDDGHGRHDDGHGRHGGRD
jgi:hypothetical protein